MSAILVPAASSSPPLRRLNIVEHVNICRKRRNREEAEGNAEVLKKNSSGALYFGVKTKRTRKLVKSSGEKVVLASPWPLHRSLNIIL